MALPDGRKVEVQANRQKGGKVSVKISAPPDVKVVK